MHFLSNARNRKRSLIFRAQNLDQEELFYAKVFDVSKAATSLVIATGYWRLCLPEISNSNNLLYHFQNYRVRREQ